MLISFITSDLSRRVLDVIKLAYNPCLLDGKIVSASTYN